MGLVGYIALGIIVLVGLLVFAVVVYYNKFTRLKITVDKFFSNIDVISKKRFDLIPNLVECVKGYMEHEQGTLQKVIEARSMYEKAGTPEEKDAVNSILTEQLRSIFALAENYPDLKANQNFMHLQSELSNVEQELVQVRGTYNEGVRQYNTEVKLFPGNLFATVLKFETINFVQATEEERKNVKVQF